MQPNRIENFEKHVVLLTIFWIVIVLIIYFLKFMLIDWRQGNVRECENFWVGMLLTILKEVLTPHMILYNSRIRSIIYAC